MKKFNYHAPKNLYDCYNLYKSSEFPLYIAGGMTLLPSIKQGLSSPTDLIDLNEIEEMKGITKNKDCITIGSITTHNELAESFLIKDCINGLAYLASKIADNSVRNRGTLGGSVCNADPAADYPAALLTLNAIINTNLRKINAKDFFLDMFETCLEEGEILKSISFIEPDFSSYKKFSSLASKYAIVGVFLSVKDQIIKIAINGASNKSFLLKELDNIDIESAKKFNLDDLDFRNYEINTDINASSEFKISLIKSLTKQLLNNLNL